VGQGPVSKVVFECGVPTVVKSSGGDHVLEDVWVKVSLVGSGAGGGRRFVQVRWTSELDPFFLFVLEVDEAEFQLLRSDQSLLIEFDAFPGYVVELLDKCVRSRGSVPPGEEQAAQHGAQRAPHFSGLMQVGEQGAVFSVVETNSFKNLNHLSLRAAKAGDRAVRGYVEDRVRGLVEGAERARREIETLRAKNAEGAAEVSRLTAELGEVRAAGAAALADKGARAAAEAAQVREGHAAEVAELRARHDRERQAASARATELDCSYREKLDELEGLNRSLLERNHKLELALSEKGQTHTHLDDELKGLRLELHAMREEKAGLERKCEQQQLELHNASKGEAVRQQAVADKDEIIRALEAQVASGRAVAEALEVSKAQLAATEERCAAVDEEVQKNKKSMETLKAENRAWRAKVKTKAALVDQHEALLRGKNATISKLEATEHDLRRSLAEATSELASLQGHNENLTAQLDESRNLVQSNHRMIKWLNSRVVGETRLADANVGRGTAASGGAGASKSPYSALLNPSPSSRVGAAGGTGGGAGAGVGPRPFIANPSGVEPPARTPAAAAGGAPPPPNI